VINFNANNVSNFISVISQPLINFEYNNYIQIYNNVFTNCSTYTAGAMNGLYFNSKLNFN